MKPSEWFKNKLNELDSDTDFRLERLILEITEEICRLMEKQDMSRSELAKSLGVSPPAVTKILRGEYQFHPPDSFVPGERPGYGFRRGIQGKGAL